MSIYKNVINYVETPDGIKQKEENVNDILIRKDNNYKGWLCWSGIYTIAIGPDGTIHNATCGNKKMGNVYEDEEIKLSEELHTCTRDWCTCAADLNIKKVKNKEYLGVVRPYVETKTLRILEVELSNRCNLKCPMCFRKDLNFKKIEDIDVSLFDKNDLSKIKHLDLCGAVSEPTLHPKLFEFIDMFDKNTSISIATNGSTHNRSWWRELGKKINKHRDSFVIFPLDGLEDTHSIYRVGSRFNKVVNNIKAFNESGANSHVQFIIFRHNQHQLEEVRKITYDLGCKEFLVRTSFFYDDKFKRPNISDFKTRHELCEIHIDRKVVCRHLDKKTIFVDYTGDVFPCCFFIKCKYSMPEKYRTESNLYLKHKDKINLYKNSVDEILSSDFFSFIHSNYKNLEICKSFCKFESQNFIKKQGKINDKL